MDSPTKTSVAALIENPRPQANIVYETLDPHLTVSFGANAVSAMNKLPADTRLLGCLNHGKIVILKVMQKNNEGKGGTLAAYKDLCKD